MSKFQMSGKIFLMAVAAVFSLAAVSCASVGYPEGGEVDRTPPKPLTSSPDNGTTNFSSAEIKIIFDEYVQLKNVSDNVLISPPFAQKPEITANGKNVQIKIKDTLRENTTYLFQFKDAVADVNEGNLLPSFDYVFSTGDAHDSLVADGRVVDALSLKPEENIYVYLYDDFSDSAVAKMNPAYLTKTDKNGYFKLKYLADRKYKILALSDSDKSGTYNNSTEKLGFLFDTITPLPDDTSRAPMCKMIRTFVQKTDVQRVASSNMTEKGKAKITTILPMVNPQITSLSGDVVTYLNASSDTLLVWAKLPSDSLTIWLKDTTGINDTIKLRIFKTKRGITPLVSTNAKGSLPYFDTVRFAFANPVDSVATDSCLVFIKSDADSLCLPLVFEDDTRLKAYLDFKLKPETTYKITLPKNSIFDIYGTANDTLQFTAKTTSPDDYGSIKITLVPVAETNFYIVQLLTDNDKIVAEKTMDASSQTAVVFNNLKAGKYTVRVIADANKNRKWDFGSYWEHLQPETVYYLPKVLELRSSWDMEELLNLNDSDSQQVRAAK